LNKALLIAVLSLLLTSLLATSVALNWSAEARLPVLNIDTGLGYATIQEAVNAGATLDGHTIQVDVGTYYENVVVDKSVSLIGENKFNTIIDGRALGSVIHITVNRVNVTGFTIRNSTYGYSGIFLDHSAGANISKNIVKNNYNGIYMYGSIDNDVTNNDVLGNEYGIHLYGSGNNNVSGNNASNNMNGIHLDVSGNNTLTGNNVRSNTGNGMYLYGSSNNTLTDNDASSNYGRGIRLHFSTDNTLLDNVFSGNRYGISLYGSGKNVINSNDASLNNESGILLQDSSNGNTITGNTVSDNLQGIWFIDSGGNTLIGNKVSSNQAYGVRFWNSSRNRLFHNNFVNNSAKNVEQPNNTSILNTWDDGAEGNFWDDYSADANVNGIGDRPYIVDANALGVYGQDSYPLMGRFFEFSAAIENQSYTTTVVSNSAVTGFLYDRGSDNKTNAMRFNVSTTQGTGFGLICIPHALVAPSYVVTADQAPPLSYNLVRTNGTHTWVYFTYPQSTSGLMIKPNLPVVEEASIWSMWWFWGMIGLALVGVLLASLSVMYRRKAAEQTKLLRTYSPFVIAEALFKADIERRGLKIKEFEKKYGVKIQPRSTLEDVFRGLETKEKEEKKS